MTRISSGARELELRCQTMPVFVRDGFIPFLPEFDEGVDFILYREVDDLLIKVQQKGRWYVDRKYIGRQIAILYRHEPRDRDVGKVWYLVPHSRLLDEAERGGYLDTKSWHGNLDPRPSLRATRDADDKRLKGAYGGTRMSGWMEQALTDFELTDDSEKRHRTYLECAHRSNALSAATDR